MTVLEVVDSGVPYVERSTIVLDPPSTSASVTVTDDLRVRRHPPLSPLVLQFCDSSESFTGSWRAKPPSCPTLPLCRLLHLEGDSQCHKSLF